MELLFLPGLQDVVSAEVARVVPQARGWQLVPGRQDALIGTVPGSLRSLLRLRTVVAPFLVLTFPVPRPKSLLSGEYFPGIVGAVREAMQLSRTRPGSSFRIEAAGRDSTVLRTFAGQLAQASGLRDDPDSGEYVVRLRPSPIREGWDVLIRLIPIPLSARSWRVAGYPAAANATVAAAMSLLSEPRADDRVANLMCGSGTLLIERLLAGPTQRAVGIDNSAEAVAAATANLRAAGLTDRAQLITGDVSDDTWRDHGPFDLLLADPPWGDKSGRHDESEALHVALLEHAHRGASRRARLLVLTHEIRIMERCLRRTSHLWRLESETRVFHKGHHPRIYLLRHADSFPSA